MSLKSLYILRHAKSSWDEPDKDDVDRALISRGVNDAYLMAKKLKSTLKNTDRVISSPANRALHTAVIFSKELDINFDRIEINPNVYEASEAIIIKIIKNLPDDLNNVLLVGHNPTFTNLANRFISPPVDNIPTAGMVGITFNVSNWNELSREKVKSYFFEFPKKE